ncbi:MAG: hypothetical protein AAFW84_09800 [Cyanobacteria bacterium J06635_15]
MKGFTWVMLWSNSEEVSARSVKDEREVLIRQAHMKRFLNSFVELDLTSLEAGLLIRAKAKNRNWSQWLNDHETAHP